MKWYDQDKTSMLDLDKVMAFNYTPPSECENDEDYNDAELCERCKDELREKGLKNQKNKRHIDVSDAYIEVYVAGINESLTFSEENAIEIYDALMSQKTLL
jgi:hypothetical protein